MPISHFFVAFLFFIVFAYGSIGYLCFHAFLNLSFNLTYNNSCNPFRKYEEWWLQNEDVVFFIFVAVIWPISVPFIMVVGLIYGIVRVSIMPAKLLGRQYQKKQAKAKIVAEQVPSLKPPDFVIDNARDLLVLRERKAKVEADLLNLNQEIAKKESNKEVEKLLKFPKRL